MIGPDDRRTLTTLLTPPPGTVLDAAVGTTYTLNLDAFLVVPALLTLTRLPPQDEGGRTPLGLLDSLRRIAERMTVFAQAGQIAAPTGTRARSLFTFLERSTVQVSAPNGGVFHPKTWTLRFLHEDGRHTHRILIASRNLTFDRSWDLVIAMDEGEGGEPLRGYPDFLRSLLRLPTPIAIGNEHQERLLDVATTIASAGFVAPPGYHSVAFRALGLGLDSAEGPFPAAIDRALVVSPFLKRTLLSSIDVPWNRLTVVSRASSLDTELDESLGCSAYELKQDLFPDDLDEVDDRDDGMRYPLSGLHAKIFVLDRGRRTTTIVGSANATHAAFNYNVETILEFAGPRAETGVERWLEPQLNREQPRFRSLLEEHIWDPGGAESSVDEESVLNRMRREVAKVPIAAHIAEAGSGSFAVRYLTEAEIPTVPGVTVLARPLTANGWNRIAKGSPLDVTVPATLEGLTAFLVYELRLGRDSTVFVVRAELVGEPPDRRSRLIAQLLQSPDQLIRYLMLLLRDEFADRFPAGGPGAERRRDGYAVQLEAFPLLERFVRTASRNPQTIGQVQQLFSDLESNPIVTPALRELWSSVWEAVSEKRNAP